MLYNTYNDKYSVMYSYIVYNFGDPISILSGLRFGDFFIIFVNTLTY